jgi:hypothetical protein
MCDTQITLLAEKDADKLAVQDLEKQLKNQSGDVARITKAKINELKTQIKAEKSMKSVLDKSRTRFIKTLETAVRASDPLTILSLDREQLVDFVIRGGFDLSIDEFIEQADLISQAVEKTTRIVQPDLGLSAIQQQLDLMQASSVETLFDDVIIPNVTSGVRESLVAMTVDVPIKQAMSSLSQKMQSATGRQLTEVNTKLSMYGRGVTAAMAEEAGLSFYLYTGPQDGETRKFCSPLVDKVVSESQMRKLNNRQGLSVKTAGGGYNCRHSWSPVSEGFIKAADLDRATTSDISDANSGAKR